MGNGEGKGGDVCCQSHLGSSIVWSHGVYIQIVCTYPYNNHNNKFETHCTVQQSSCCPAIGESYLVSDQGINEVIVRAEYNISLFHNATTSKVWTCLAEK